MLHCSWNTHRLYAADGQRIEAVHTGDFVYFTDYTRNISGRYERTDLGLHDTYDLRRSVMRFYDAGLYTDISDHEAAQHFPRYQAFTKGRRIDAFTSGVYATREEAAVELFKLQPRRRSVLTYKVERTGDIYRPWRVLDETCETRTRRTTA